MTFIDFLSTFSSVTRLNILYVCGSGAVGSGCCDYQGVMNALLMSSEQLDSASLGRMTATVCRPPHPTPPLTDTLTFTSTEVFFSQRSSSSSFTHAGVNAQVHPYICYSTPLLPQPSYYATATLHVLFINDRGRELGRLATRGEQNWCGSEGGGRQEII